MVRLKTKIKLFYLPLRQIEERRTIMIGRQIQLTAEASVADLKLKDLFCRNGRKAIGLDAPNQSNLFISSDQNGTPCQISPMELTIGKTQRSRFQPFAGKQILCT